MDSCELMTGLYELAWQVIARMNELDQQQNHINFINKLYVWTRVNEWLDFMDSTEKLS